MEEKIKHKLTYKEHFDNLMRDRIKPYFRDFNNLFYYVCFLFLMGIIFYISSLAVNGFAILPSGDYVYQSVPFFHNGYDDWWKFLTTGEFPFWDPNTFLGADNLGNNGFYYVMDPFFLLTLFFPRAWMVQIMAILMIVKMVLAAVFFRLLLKSFGVEEKKSRIFAMCYGFGGWMIFYCRFNVFMEAVTWLPLILLGIEKVLKREKPFVLIFSLFALGLSNFYFLIPICIGGVMYALFRWAQTIKTRKIGDNFVVLGMGVLAFALGLALAAFFLMPAILTTMTYNRSEGTYLTDLIKLFGDKKYYEAYMQISSWESVYPNAGYRAMYPLMSFLFPVTDGRSVGIMDFNGNRYDELASSLYPYAPLVLLFFATIIKSVKEKKISHIMAIIFFCFALSWPFFYFMFLAFTKAYGRWEVIPYAFIILYVAVSYKKSEDYKKRYFDLGYVIQLGLMIFSTIMAFEYPYQYSRVEVPTYRWAVIIIQFVYSFVLWILFRNNFKKEGFINNAKWFILSECCVLGIYFSISHGYTNYFGNDFLNGKDNVTIETKIIEDLNKRDKNFFRIQSDGIAGSGTNIAMLENYNGLSVFHSTYNSNIDQFFNWSRMINSYGNWTGNAIDKRPLLDTFLGVKYYFTKDINTNFAVNDKTIRHVKPNIPFGYNVNSRVGEYTLYENKNFIEMGFTFDNVVDPNLADSKTMDDPYKVYSDFFTSSDNTVQTLTNDNSFLSSAIYSREDISKVKEKYKADFASNDLKIGKRSAPAIESLTHGNDYNSTVYRLPSNFDPENPLEFLTTGDKSDQSSKLKYASDILVLTPSNARKYFNSSIGTTNSSALYIKKPIYDAYKIGYFLVTEDGKTITYDNNLLLDAYYKNCRTLYTGDNKIKYIIGIPYKEMEPSSVRPYNIYTYAEDTYNEKINELKKYKLENCTHSTNTYKCTTNFDKRRFIVLNVAFDKGWKCNATLSDGSTKQLDVFKSTGGFVSVVGEPGNVSYEFNFKSEYFNTGLIISLVALTGVGAMFGIYEYLRHLKRKKALVDDESNIHECFPIIDKVEDEEQEKK
ncbi:MAG: YfhO family protein [Bacilli bacterium]